MHWKCPIFEKVAKTFAKPKKAKNVYIITQFKSPKSLDQTTFETLYDYNNPCIEKCPIFEKVAKTFAKHQKIQKYLYHNSI